MFRATTTLCVAALLAAAGSAAAAPPRHRAARKAAQVEMIYMTWPEIYNAIHKEGKTTVLIYNGGTEQRGPQCVLGGHTLMGERTANLIAEKLGNALVAPVMPFSPTGVSEIHPGGVSVPPAVFKAVNEAVVDSEVKNGFKTVVLMGDHGGGQDVLAEVAREKNAHYSPQGVHVFFCGDVYKKANDEFNDYLTAHHLPLSEHAGIPDTSEMIYFGGAKWVRMNKITFGDPIPPPGQRLVLKVNNGIIGDARGSSARLGRIVVDMKVDDAVRQIRGFQAAERAGGR